MKRVLLVGSAFYTPNWWDENLDKLSYFHSICCINNAFKITGSFTDVWYMPNDFLINKKYDLSEFKCSKASRITICSKFIDKPCWYDDGCKGGTMMFNAIFDILNRCIFVEYPLELSLIGCDMNYTNTTKTHFYEGGTNDPLRLGEDTLIKVSEETKYIFSKSNSKIYNISTEKSFLKFDRNNLKEMITRNS